MAVESDDSVSELIRPAVSSLRYTEIRLLQETAVRAFSGYACMLLVQNEIPLNHGMLPDVPFSPERLAAKRPE